MKDKFILDVTCGGRTIWFDKKHPNTIYGDIRNEKKGFCPERFNFEINPDIIIDFRKLPFKDKSFKMVIWDPPHIKSRNGKRGIIEKKYGGLNRKNWGEDLKNGFNECWRILEDYGTLIFKWNENEIKTKEILKLFHNGPLIGHTTGSNSKTKWFAFMKIPKIKKLNIIELFCGSGSISKEFEKRGHNVFSIDIRKRKGICEPTLRKDILKVTLKDIPFKKVDVIWASPPCDCFSKACANLHFDKDNNPKTEKCLEHIQILKKTLTLIEKISPDLFFIENPDGKMKFQKPLIQFLVRNEAMIKKLYYSNYGFPLPKPTNIFTNALNFIPKNNSIISTEKELVIFNNLTKCQRQQIPKELVEDIVNYCEKSLASI